MFFSKSTGGFYDLEIYGKAIPTDAKEITELEHSALLASQASGKVMKADANGRPIAVDPDPLTAEQIKTLMANAVQVHMDAAAKARGYDSLLSAVSYADEAAVTTFQTEGKALRAWRSNVWAACYKLLAEVQAGTRAVPTAAQLIGLLPALVL